MGCVYIYIHIWCCAIVHLIRLMRIAHLQLWTIFCRFFFFLSSLLPFFSFFLSFGCDFFTLPYARIWNGNAIDHLNINFRYMNHYRCHCRRAWSAVHFNSKPNTFHLKSSTSVVNEFPSNAEKLHFTLESYSVVVAVFLYFL